jgi:hypothetical protein
VRVKAHLALATQRQTRPTELRGVAVDGREHNPGRAHRTRPWLAPSVGTPLAPHTQMRVQDQSAAEVKQQMLAARLGKPEALTLERGQPSRLAAERA